MPGMTEMILIAWIELKSIQGDWDDRVNFKATIWKRSHMTGHEAIGTIKGYPRNHFNSSNKE